MYLLYAIFSINMFIAPNINLNPFCKHYWQRKHFTKSKITGIKYITSTFWNLLVVSFHLVGSCGKLLRKESRKESKHLSFWRMRTYTLKILLNELNPKFRGWVHLYNYSKIFSLKYSILLYFNLFTIINIVVSIKNLGCIYFL